MDVPVVIFAVVIFIFGILMIFAGIRIIRTKQVIQVRKLTGQDKKKEYPRQFREPEILSGQVAIKTGIINILLGAFCLIIGSLFLASQIWK